MNQLEFILAQSEREQPIQEIDTLAAIKKFFPFPGRPGNASIECVLKGRVQGVNLRNTVFWNNPRSIKGYIYNQGFDGVCWRMEGPLADIVKYLKQTLPYYQISNVTFRVMPMGNFARFYKESSECQQKLAY